MFYPYIQLVSFFQTLLVTLNMEVLSLSVKKVLIKQHNYIILWRESSKERLVSNSFACLKISGKFCVRKIASETSISNIDFKKLAYMFICRKFCEQYVDTCILKCAPKMHQKPPFNMQILLFTGHWPPVKREVVWLFHTLAPPNWKCLDPCLVFNVK
jgi:hypothetical protein